MWSSRHFPADLVTFTEQMVNGKISNCAVNEVEEDGAQVKLILNLLNFQLFKNSFLKISLDKQNYWR